LYYITPAKPCS